MTTPPATQQFDTSSRKFASIAQEIALDLNPLETILKSHQIDVDEFERIQRNPTFKKYLEDALQVWGSAMSMGERVKLKQLFLLENSLEELYARLHDQKEPLSAKVELFKALQRGGGNIGVVTEGGNSERVQITINLGSDSKLKFDKAAPILDLEPVK